MYFLPINEGNKTLFIPSICNRINMKPPVEYDPTLFA